MASVELKNFIEKYSPVYFQAFVESNFCEKQAWEYCVEETKDEYQLFNKCFDNNILELIPSFGEKEANIISSFEEKYFLK